MNDQIRSKHVEQTKNCEIKNDYKNCASRWLLTHTMKARAKIGVWKKNGYIDSMNILSSGNV